MSFSVQRTRHALQACRDVYPKLDALQEAVQKTMEELQYHAPELLDSTPGHLLKEESQTWLEELDNAAQRCGGSMRVAESALEDLAAKVKEQS